MQGKYRPDALALCIRVTAAVELRYAFRVCRICDIRELLICGEIGIGNGCRKEIQPFVMPDCGREVCCVYQKEKPVGRCQGS